MEASVIAWYRASKHACYLACELAFKHACKLAW